MYARSPDENRAKFDKTAKRLCEGNLMIQISKCGLYREVAYWGQIINQKGAKTRPGRIAAGSEFPVPRTMTNTHVFGTCGMLSPLQWYVLANFKTIQVPSAKWRNISLGVWRSLRYIRFANFISGRIKRFDKAKGWLATTYAVKRFQPYMYINSTLSLTIVR